LSLQAAAKTSPIPSVPSEPGWTASVTTRS
jgi:hypothetical protein